MHVIKLNPLYAMRTVNNVVNSFKIYVHIMRTYTMRINVSGSTINSHLYFMLIKYGKRCGHKHNICGYIFISCYLKAYRTKTNILRFFNYENGN